MVDLRVNELSRSGKERMVRRFDHKGLRQSKTVHHVGGVMQQPILLLVSALVSVLSCPSVPRC